MSRYSLTNECIKSINDYDDQSFIAEMSVLSALLDSYEKAITIMEYSGNVPEVNDLSLFQESAFFQEEEVENGQPSGDVSNTSTDGQVNTQQDNNNTNNNQNNGQQQKTMSEKERKEYNKKHWIRQINKKGNVENIFISIIAFIIRFFMFLGRCLVKLFKKITGKDVKKETEDIKNADPSKKDEAVKNIENAINNPDNTQQDSQNGNNNTNNNQTANNDNNESSAEPVVFQINSQSPENLKTAEEIIKTNNVMGLDYNKLTNIFNEILNNVIQNIQMDTAADQVNPNDGKAVNSMRKIIPELKTALSNKITVDDTAYVEAFENFKKVCDNVQKVSNDKVKEFSEWQEKIKNESGKGTIDLKVVNAKREIVMGLRDLCKIIAEASNASGNDYSKNCDAIDTAVKFIYGEDYGKIFKKRLNPTAAAAAGKRDVKADNAEIRKQFEQSQSGGTTNNGGGGDNQ